MIERNRLQSVPRWNSLAGQYTTAIEAFATFGAYKAVNDRDQVRLQNIDPDA